MYPIVVEQAFRGVREGSTVYLYQLDLPEQPAAGRRYLVYGAFNFGLNTEIVTPTTIVPVEKAERDLAFLSSSESRSATTGRIYGVVQQGKQERRQFPVVDGFAEQRGDSGGPQADRGLE